MNFKLKALAVLLASVAAVPAQAALANGASGNGELLLQVYSTETKQSFAFDLTPVVGYEAFNSFSINDFLPGDLTNKPGQAGSIGTTTAIAGGGAAEADGLDIQWNLTNNAAFLAFAAANTDSSLWQWQVVASDDTGSSTTLNARRYLTTIQEKTPANGLGDVFAQSSGSFGGMTVVAGYYNDMNTAAPGVDDPSVYLTKNFVTSFGETWGGKLPAGYEAGSAVNTMAAFYYLTGRSTTAINEQYENGAAFAFDYDAASGTATLKYVTLPVPEADTYAMMLAGLGLMGLVARRRSK